MGKIVFSSLILTVNVKTATVPLYAQEDVDQTLRTTIVDCADNGPMLYKSLL